jgi:hypothetical protein
LTRPHPLCLGQGLAHRALEKASPAAPWTRHCLPRLGQGVARHALDKALPAVPWTRQRPPCLGQGIAHPALDKELPAAPWTRRRRSFGWSRVMEAPHAQWLWPRWQNKAGKKGPGRPRDLHETFKVLNNFGPAGRRNPPGAVKFDGEVRGPQLAGRTLSPHKGAQGKEASFLFRPNLLAAAKGGRDGEAKAVAKDDSDTVEDKALAKDDSDDDEGTSVGRPRRKAGDATGGRSAVVVTG